MKIIVSGREYAVDLEDFTLGEAREIKRVSGFTLAGWQDALGQSDPDALTALVWVCVRRENPSVTLEEIEAQGLATLVVDETATGGDALPPTLAPGDALDEALSS